MAAHWDVLEEIPTALRRNLFFPHVLMMGQWKAPICTVHPILGMFQSAVTSQPCHVSIYTTLGKYSTSAFNPSFPGI